MGASETPACADPCERPLNRGQACPPCWPHCRPAGGLPFIVLLHNQSGCFQWTADRRVWRRKSRVRVQVPHVASSSGALLPAPPVTTACVRPMPACSLPLVMSWSPARLWHPRPGGEADEWAPGPNPVPALGLGHHCIPGSGPDLGPWAPAAAAGRLPGINLAGFINLRSCCLARRPLQETRRLRAQPDNYR